MADPNLLGTAGETFGFADWQTGAGAVGNMFIWLILVIVVTAFVGFLIFLWIYRQIYKYNIIIIGKMGNSIVEKHLDKAKIVPVGRAGDRLIYVRKLKRYLPPPTLQIGRNKYLYFEREDGELINIAYEDLNETQRELGVRFVDTDMRMQRLGIEKNLQYRLQKEGFWDKHGQTIINAIFYVLVTVMLIVLFVQWRKTAESIETAVKVAGDVLQSAKQVSPNVPTEPIPAMIFLFIQRQRLRWQVY